jgi:hypothetical protein
VTVALSDREGGPLSPLKWPYWIGILNRADDADEQHDRNPKDLVSKPIAGMPNHVNEGCDSQGQLSNDQRN